jgi:hypothetical protein
MSYPDFDTARHMRGTWELLKTPIDASDCPYENIFHTLLHQGDNILAIAIKTAHSERVLYQQARIMGDLSAMKSLLDYMTEIIIGAMILAIMAIHTDILKVVLLGEILLIALWFYVDAFNRGLHHNTLYCIDATKAMSLPIQDINRLNHLIEPGDRILYFKGTHGHIIIDIVRTKVGWERNYFVNLDMLC